MSEQPATTTTNEPGYKLPSEATLKHAVKLSIVEDKPLLLDYWTASLDKKALVGVRESGEKLLVTLKVWNRVELGSFLLPIIP